MANIRIPGGYKVAPTTESARIRPQAFVTEDGGLSDTAVKVGAGLVHDERVAQEKQIAEFTAEARRQDAEARRQQHEIRAAKGTEAYTGFHADLAEMTDGMVSQLNRGEVTRDKLPELFRKSVEDLKKKRLEGLDAEMAATVTNHMTNFERVAAGQIRGALETDQKREGAAAITGSLESLGRTGVTDPAGAVKQASAILDAQGPGIFGADKVALQKQSFAERTWYSHFASRVTAARGNAQALKQIEGEIGQNEVLDPDKKTALIGHVMSMQETLAAKAERAQASRLRTVERSLNGLSDVMMKGYDVPPEQLLPVLNAAKGTELEPMARNLIGLNKMTATFRTLPTQAQEATLTELEQKVRANPTKGNVETLDAFKTIATHQKAEIKDDPITFASRKGLADVKPLDFGNLAALGDQLAARLDIAGGMRARYNAPLAVLTREEAGTVSRLLKDGPIEQKRAILGTLAGALPDKQAFATVMQQIAPDDPVTAVAGIYASRGLKDGNGRAVSDDILRGQAALNPGKKADGTPVGGKVFPMPPDKELQQSFAAYEKNAYAGKEGARNAALQTARAIYAARALEEGDFTGELNSRRWEKAMEAATGGIDKYRGRSVVLPYGKTYSEFKDGVAQRAKTLADSGVLDEQMTARRLAGLPLENVGDGRYVFRAGDGVLAGKDGKPVVLDFNRP